VAIVLIGGMAYTLFYDSTDLFYHKKVEVNKDSLTVGEYLQKEELLPYVKITPEVISKLVKVREFIEKSDTEPSSESGDIIISIGGSKIENILFIRFTNKKPE
jgi:hypothetical protein